MKKILLIFCFQLLVTLSKAQDTPAKSVAARIADNISQVLELSKEKRDSIYTVNLWLHDRKVAVRQRFSNPDSLRININREERLRDSLYKPILGDGKFLLYCQKKVTLLNIN